MFDDFLNTFKGVGIIGMFLGAFVLAGFLFISLLVFDPRFGGRIEPEDGIVLRQGKEIITLENRLQELKNKSKPDPDFHGLRGKLEEVLTENSAQAMVAEDLERQIEVAVAARQQMEDEFQVFVAKRRHEIRSDAVGEVLPDIELRDGRVFSNPTILKVSPAGIHIRSKEGTARLLFINLDEKLRERFDYDSGEMADFLESERDSNKLYKTQLENELLAIRSDHRAARLDYISKRVPVLQGRIRDRHKLAERGLHGLAGWELEKRNGRDRTELSQLFLEFERLQSEANQAGETPDGQ